MKILLALGTVLSFCRLQPMEIKVASPCTNPGRNYKVEIKEQTRHPHTTNYRILIWSQENTNCPWIVYNTVTPPLPTLLFDPQNRVVMTKHIAHKKLFYLFSVKTGNQVDLIEKECHEQDPEFSEDGTLLWINRDRNEYKKLFGSILNDLIIYKRPE